MYVCMYVCTYVRMYVCTYVRMYVCTYVRMYVCTYVRMYVCTYVRMYVCTYVRMYVCTYVRMYVCMYVCMLYACNVSSWLVARVAIVANVLQIILKRMYCLLGSLLWQKNGRAFFWKKACNCWEANFFLKNAEAQSSFCSALYLSL